MATDGKLPREWLRTMNEPQPLSPSTDRRSAARGPRNDDGRPYAPQPLGPQPLCIALPAGWYDDPYYELSPYAYAGCDALPRQFGVIGTCADSGELIASDFGGCFAHAFFGTPHSGKTYAEGVYLESALLHNPYQTRLPYPLCALSFGFGRHGGGSHMAEQMVARYPNHDPAEVRRLVHDHGTLPQGIEDVVGLTVSRQAGALREQHPHSQVLPLRFPCCQLGIDNLKRMMIMDDQAHTLMAEQVSELVDGLPHGFTKEDLIGRALRRRFAHKGIKRLVLKRLRLACQLIDDECDVRGLIRPGRLIAVELRDMWLPWTRAMKLFQVVLDVMVMGEGGLPCNLLLAIGEAHKFLKDPGVRETVEELIKERRHLGLSVVLSSQDPTAVPRSTLAEMDGVGLFRMDSERLVKHVGRDFVAFKQLTARDTAALKDGQMFFWSQKWHVPDAPGTLDGYLVKVQVRPRMSHHGGATRVAGGGSA